MMTVENLWQLARQSIESLENERGVLASARDEAYGCLFGRDSLIVGLNLVSVYEKTGDAYYLALVEKILQALSELQGRELLLESGEEPGKIIHEFRPDNHERLTAPREASHPAESAWFVYPDSAMRNYDTVDATPLYLMLMDTYLRVSGNEAFLDARVPNVIAALEWLLTYGDTNGDGLIDYRFHPDRRHGGLQTQSWMDSSESIFFDDSDERPHYPIAPVEVQAYAWVALRTWSARLSSRNASFAEQLGSRAALLKKQFNERFVLALRNRVSLAFALDGEGRALTSPRSSMGHVLWAAHRTSDGRVESVLDEAYLPAVVARVMARDLFVPRAGVRTLSSCSPRFDPLSYHNGSIWPHDTAMLAAGLGTFGYAREAHRVHQSLLRAYRHFRTPIELYGYRHGKFLEYQTSSGATACRVQAWSAASLLATLRSCTDPL